MPLQHLVKNQISEKKSNEPSFPCKIDQPRRVWCVSVVFASELPGQRDVLLAPLDRNAYTHITYCSPRSRQIKNMHNVACNTPFVIVLYPTSKVHQFPECWYCPVMDWFPVYCYKEMTVNVASMQNSKHGTREASQPIRAHPNPGKVCAFILTSNHSYNET